MRRKNFVPFWDDWILIRRIAKYSREKPPPQEANDRKFKFSNKTVKNWKNYP